MDVFFVFDIVITFLTEYTDKVTNLEVSNLKAIAKNYLRTTLIADIVAGFPFQLMEIAGGDFFLQSDWFKLAKLPRLYRAFKIFRILKIAKILGKSNILNRYQDLLHMNASYFRLLKTFCMVFFSVHMIACFFYFQATLHEDTVNTWVWRF